jgi:hypothetical protein
MMLMTHIYSFIVYYRWILASEVQFHAHIWGSDMLCFSKRLSVAKETWQTSLNAFIRQCISHSLLEWSCLTWGVVMLSGLEHGSRYFNVSQMKALRDIRYVTVDNVFVTGRFVP